MSAIQAPQQQNRDPRVVRKVDEIIQVLAQYYPEVQFFRKLLLFEYFPLTILFYGIIHLIFYFISTTEDSLVSILILVGVLALISWKMAVQIVLPTYVNARKRTMGKKGMFISLLYLYYSQLPLYRTKYPLISWDYPPRVLNAFIFIPL